MCTPFGLLQSKTLLAPGINISHETVRLWWNRFGPLFASEIHRSRIRRMRTYPDWQWHKLRSYDAAMIVTGNDKRQEAGRWQNNRAENSHPLPDNGLFANHEKGPFRRRERPMLRFRRMRSLQKFTAIHSSVYKHFNPLTGRVCLHA